MDQLIQHRNKPQEVMRSGMDHPEPNASDSVKGLGDELRRWGEDYIKALHEHQTFWEDRPTENTEAAANVALARLWQEWGTTHGLDDRVQLKEPAQLEEEEAKLPEVRKKRERDKRLSELTTAAYNARRKFENTLEDLGAMFESTAQADLNAFKSLPPCAWDAGNLNRIVLRVRHIIIKHGVHVG